MHEDMKRKRKRIEKLISFFSIAFFGSKIGNPLLGELV